MKSLLRSMQLLPRGADGWTSPALIFGRRTTLVSGPLGSGKTPVMKALAFALGAAVELPPAIRDRCGSVHLSIQVGEDIHHLRRAVEPGLAVCAEGPDGEIEISDELEFSRLVLQKLGVPGRELVNLQGNATFSYMNVLAPVFLVDQDTGWAAPYVPASRFVKDQREEVMRWTLELPPKHRAAEKADFEDAKTEQALLQQQIAFKRRTIEKLIKEDERLRGPSSFDTLTQRRGFLHEQLRTLSEVLTPLTRSESVLDARLRDLGARRDGIRGRLQVLIRRRDQILSVQGDVQTETQALEQNEVAAEAFRRLCGNEGCRFFRQPDDSYGRRLLYLKDQLKDFGLSAGSIAAEIDRLEAELQEAEGEVRALLDEKKRALADSGAAETIATLESLTKELTDVSVLIDRIERLSMEQRQLGALIDQELRAGEKVAELKPTRGRRENSRLLDARTYLAAAFNEWIEALETPNVPRDATVDKELRVIVGGEKLDAKISHSGSTRTRLVLAFHGALVETSLKMGGNHPPVLALDAPRQHELGPDEVRLFVDRFEEIAGDRVQLVLSATDEDVVTRGEGVEIWAPSYVFGHELRYLGPVGINATE